MSTDDTSHTALPSVGAVVGDRVKVSWENSWLEGTLKHLPQGAGDSWVIWTDQGWIYHIQQFESLLVLNRDVFQPSKGTV